jgi:two-component system sensor histidine kinase MtrB
VFLLAAARLVSAGILPDTPVRIRVERVEDAVLISVDDSGPGIAHEERAEEREAIFEIFNRGNGDGMRPPGTGIGLALVAQFTSLHGGRAWVEPNDEGGSSFRVLLPARQPS